MQELKAIEIEEVSGAGFWYDLGRFAAECVKAGKQYGDSDVMYTL